MSSEEEKPRVAQRRRPNKMHFIFRAGSYDVKRKEIFYH
jgi:hypothetical protein